jgi:Family of unknown function (DUF6152)
MKRNAIATMAVLGALWAALPAFAHHAVQAQFDFDKPLSLTGVLTKVEWINPHSYMFLDVKDEAGNVKKWALELVGPGGLRKAGLSRADRGGFKVGDTITVNAFASKDGSDSGFVKELKLPDGRLVTIWFGDPNAR